MKIQEPRTRVGREYLIRSVFSLVLMTGSASGAHFDFGLGVGVKGGVPTNELLEATAVVSGSQPVLSQESNYIVGPVVELRLPFGFAFETDGLYRGTSYNVTNSGSLPTHIDSSSWEVPYLAKFRFPIPLLKPFVLGGGAYRSFNNLPSGVTPIHNGVVGGAGLELRISRVRLSAEGRYLRWGEPPSNDFARLARSQFEVLFGVIFGAAGK
jgi:hypothetical protein